MPDNEKKTKAAESLDDAALKDVVGGTGNTNQPPQPQLVWDVEHAGPASPPPDPDPS